MDSTVPTRDGDVARLSKQSQSKKGKARKRRFPTLLKVLLVVLILAGIGGGFYVWRMQATASAAGQQTITLPVTQGDLNITVQSNGTIEASRQASVNYQTAGTVVEVLVKSGDKVEAGQPLLRQTDTDQKAAVASAQAALNTAQAKLDDLQKGSSPAEIASANADVQSAQAALDTLVKGATPKQIADAQADVRSAQANLAQIQAGATPKQTADAQADLKTARANYDAVKAGATPKQIADAQAELNTAQANYDAVKAGATPKEISDAEADLKSAQAKYGTLVAPPSASAVKEAQSKLASAKSKLTTLKAGPDPAKLSSAQLAVTQAEASLKSIHTQAALDKQTKQLAMEKANRDLQSAQRTYGNIAAQVLDDSGNVTVPSTDPKYTSYWNAYNAMKDAEATQTQAIDALNNTIQKEVDDSAAAQAKIDDARKQLATVQAGATTDELTTAQLDVDTAQKALDDLMTGASKDDVTGAQTAVTKAQNTLDELKAGPTKDKLAAAQTTLDKAKTALNDLKAGPTQDALASAQAGVVKAQSALDELKAGPTKDKLVAAQTTLDKARDTLNDLLAGSSPDKIAAAKATLASKQSALANLTQPATASDIAAAQQAVASAQNTLTTANADLEKTVLKAPFGGTIASVTAAPNDKVSVGTAALTIYDESGMHVQLAVNESDIQKIKSGEPASITVDALPRQVFTGTVSEVSNVATTSQNVVTYQVNVDFNPEGQAVKTGMSAAANINVESHPGVIQVPTRAIKTQGRTKTITVLYGPSQTPVTVAITTGASNTQFTEITECVDTGNQCLRAGDTVAVTITTSTTTNNPATGTGFGGFGGGFGGGGGQFTPRNGGTNRAP